MMSLLSSKEKRPKLMPYKILMCSEPNETIIHKLLERFPASPCPYLCFIVYLSLGPTVTSTISRSYLSLG